MIKPNLSKFLLLTLLTFAQLLLSCSYEKTNLDLGSSIGSTWSFSSSSNYQFDSNHIEIVNGKAQLKTLDLSHVSSDFINSNHTGIVNGVGGNVELLYAKSSGMDVRTILANKVSALVGYWPLDNDFNDVSAQAQHGVSAGAVLSSEAHIGEKSALLDGATGYIDIGNIAPSSYTKMAWIKQTKASGNNNILSGNINNRQAFWVVENSICGTGFYLAAGHSQGGFDYRSLCDPSPFPLSEWQHVAVTYNENTLTMNLYRNGTVVNTLVGLPPHAATSLQSQIGAYSGANVFGGFIDEISYWNEDLTADDILSVYNAQSKVSSRRTELAASWTPHWESLVGYWKLDGNGHDSSGNSLHASNVVNTPNYGAGGKVGSGFLQSSVDGQSDLLGVPDDGSLDIPDNLSFSVWLKYNTAATINQVSISKMSSTSTAQFRTYFHGHNRQFTVLGNAGGAWVYISATAVLEFDRWYHIGFSYNSVDGGQLYVDGEKFGSRTASGTLGQNDADLSFGENVGIDFESNIDDFALWKVELGANDFSLIYHRQKQALSGYFESASIDIGSSEVVFPGLKWVTPLAYSKDLIGDFNLDTNPQSDSTTDYVAQTESLSNGLIVNWNFDEDLLTGVSGEVKDSSGQGLDATSFGALSSTLKGKLHRAVVFDGVNDSVEVPVNYPQGTIVNETVSAWFKKEGDPGADSAAIIARVGGGSGQSNSNIEIISLDANFNNIECRGAYDTGILATTSVAVTQSKWTHVACSASYSGGAVTLSFYVDGELVDSQTSVAAAYAFDGTFWKVGAQKTFFSRFFKGLIDSVSVWNRVLSADEVRKVYQRAVNRVKLQVKSCVDVTCQCKAFNTLPPGSSSDCDGDGITNAEDSQDIYKAEYIGPGGDGTTYYEEHYNRTASDLTFNCGNNTSDDDSLVCAYDEVIHSGSLSPSGPLFSASTYSQFLFPQPNSYIKYRVLMEADNNSACMGAPCLPELTSLSFNLDDQLKYSGGLQEIRPKSPILFSQIKSIDIDADSCVRFRLSRDGTDYYYNSTAWVPVTSATDNSSQSEVEQEFRSFITAYGAGSLEVVAYLDATSNLSQQCTISDINITYTD